MPGIKDKYQISLKVVLKNNDGKTLILKAPPASRWGKGGFYDLPGGRIDTDEFDTSFTDIVQREVVEEMGNVQISVSEKPVALGRHRIIPSLGYEDSGAHVLYVFFEAEFLGGEIKISEEHDGYEWVDLDEIDLETYFTSGILEGVKMYLGR